jgi:hypothetical protein
LNQSFVLARLPDKVEEFFIRRGGRSSPKQSRRACVRFRRRTISNCRTCDCHCNSLCEDHRLAKWSASATMRASSGRRHSNPSPALGGRRWTMPIARLQTDYVFRTGNNQHIQSQIAVTAVTLRQCAGVRPAWVVP